MPFRVTRIHRTLWAVAALAAAAHAQCGRWLGGNPVPGVDGPPQASGRTVSAFVRWDPDGPGPQPELLVIGGDFTLAGDVPAPFIAAFDGAAWRPVGDGLNGPVRALALYQGRLVAAGQFTIAGEQATDSIAMLNDGLWTPLGAGIPGTVYTLGVLGTDLFAGGAFGVAGGAPASNIARWDGAAWSPLGPGVNWPVLDVFPWGDDLLVGGFFSAAGGEPAPGLARWDGQAWSSMGSWTTGTVDGFAIWRGDLYVAGEFDGPLSYVTGVMRLHDGAWSPLPATPTYGPYALGVFQDELVAVGPFDVIGGQTVGRAARWNGVQWLPLAEGLNNTAEALCVYHGRLYFGGAFSLAGLTPARMVASWDGHAWAALTGGLSDQAFSPIVFNGDLYVSGRFWNRSSSSLPQGGVLRWDGARWHEVGGPTWGDSVTLAVFEGQLVGAGYFLPPAGPPSNGAVVCRWTGSQWEPFTTPLNNSVYALAEYDGGLVAGGPFTASGPTQLRRVARWNGAAWVALDWLSDAPAALCVHQGALYAGGYFSGGSGAVLDNIARWNPALLRWDRIGAGASGVSNPDGPAVVTALASFNNELYAGGTFPVGNNADGSLVTLNRIGAWNGSRWRAFGDGSLSTVYALIPADDSLLAIGQFDVGNSQTRRVARWDSQAWRALGPDLDSYPYGLVRHHAETVVTGAFLRAGDVVSSRLARWSDTGVPWIVLDPAPAAAVLAGDAAFAVTPAAGYDDHAGLSFAWTRDGAPVLDGPGGASPGGGLVVGAGTASLSILGVRHSDAGLYACSVSNSCGGSTSAPAPLTVTGCDPDFNADGNADQDDVAYLVNILAGAPNPSGRDPDFNHDGNADQDDYAALVNAIAGGPCP